MCTWKLVYTHALNCPFNNMVNEREITHPCSIYTCYVLTSAYLRIHFTRAEAILASLLYNYTGS